SSDLSFFSSSVMRSTAFARRSRSDASPRPRTSNRRVSATSHRLSWSSSASMGLWRWLGGSGRGGLRRLGRRRGGLLLRRCLGLGSPLCVARLLRDRLERQRGDDLPELVAGAGFPRALRRELRDQD